MASAACAWRRGASARRSVEAVSGRSGHAGFTILELLVALVVMGMLMVLLDKGVAAGVTAWSAQSRVIGGQQDLDAVSRVLRGLVEQIDPGTERKRLRLGAGPHAVSFATELSLGTTPLRRRTIDATVLLNNHQLVLRWTPRAHAIRLQPPPSPIETELVGGVEQLEIAYQQVGSTRWRSDWPGDELPGLIRFRLVFAAGDRRHWPEIVAAPGRVGMAE